MIRKQPKAKKKIDPLVVRRWVIIGAIVAVVLLTGFNIWLAKTVKVEKAIAQSQSSGEALIGGDFSGIRHDGTPFTFSETNGTLRLVFFGFTHCPDICPTSLATLSEVQTSLSDDASKVTPIFVTVDPQRDTADVVKDYISNFHPSMIGVTGDKAQLTAAADAFKVYHSKGKAETDGSYMMDHSGYIYLMDSQGKYIAHFGYDDPADKIISSLKPHL